MVKKKKDKKKKSRIVFQLYLYLGCMFFIPILYNYFITLDYGAFDFFIVTIVMSVSYVLIIREFILIIDKYKKLQEE